MVCRKVNSNPNHFGLNWQYKLNRKAAVQAVPDMDSTAMYRHGMYYISAIVCSVIQDYPFILPPFFVAKEIGLLFLSAIPMLAFFWTLSVCIRTPIFSIGFGLASIVPSVLFINTKVWFVYPMSYPFFVITSEYGKLAANLDPAPVELIPWVPAAAIVTILCLVISCLCFGQVERR